MVGLWEQLSSDQCGQLDLDLEAFPRSLRVNRDAVYKRPEIVDQRTAVVLCAGVAGHRLGKRVDGLDVAVQGRRMQRNRDGGFFERSQFRLNAQSLFFQLRNPSPSVLLGNHVLDDEIDVALPLTFDPV